MKKRIFAIAAAIIIPLFLAYFLAKLMTPSAEKLFMNKMNYYFGTEDFYVEKLYRADSDSYRVKQSKVKDNYYIIFNDNSDTELLLNIEAEDVYYGNSDVAVRVPRHEFEDNRSIILSDKFSLDDIDKTTISLDKEHKGLYYTFSLNNGAQYSVLFEKGKLVQLTVYNTEYLPHISPQAADMKQGKVSIEYSQWQTPSDMSKVTKLSNDARIVSLDELVNLGQEADDLKYALGLLDEYDEYDEDDNDNDDDYSRAEDIEEKEEYRDFEVLDF